MVLKPAQTRWFKGCLEPTIFRKTSKSSIHPMQSQSAQLEHREEPNRSLYGSPGQSPDFPDERELIPTV